MKQKCKFLLLLILSIFLLTGAARVSATVTISNLNSEVTMDPSSSAGIYDWKVGGTDYLDTQWFWYRIGSGAVESIDTLSVTTSQPSPDEVTLNYSGRDIAVRVNLFITGDSSQVDLVESVRVTNKSGKTQQFNFFQFSDFDFGSSATNDEITVQAANVISQTEHGGTLPKVMVTATTSWAYQVGDAASLLTHITDGNDLNGNADLSPNDDASFAWQWKKTLSNGSSFTFGKIKTLNPVPIPGSMLLLLSGFLGVISIKRKRLFK